MGRRNILRKPNKREQNKGKNKQRKNQIKENQIMEKPNKWKIKVVEKQIRGNKIREN